MCERLAAFGIGLNLVTYLVSNLHLEVAFSANVVTNYLGTAYLTCLLGGYVADTYIGRFWTILLGAVLQFAGMVVLTLSATLPGFRLPPCSGVGCQPARGWDMAILYAGLYLVAVGTGGIKSSVSALGADQFDDTDLRERKLKSGYFNWFFMAIEVGAVLSVTALIYVQIRLGRGWGFGVTAAAMLVAIAVLVAGAPLYRYQATLEGSTLSQVARVVAAAFRNRRLPLPPPSLLHEAPDDAAAALHTIPHTAQFRYTPPISSHLHYLPPLEFLSNYPFISKTYHTPSSPS
jgi:dipeptide/tripeptide permease